MGKYWDCFAAEFERIGRKLGPERRESILESLKEHAGAAQQELMQAGMGLEEAEKVAVTNLGAPSDVIRAEADRPKWQWLPVWVALIGLLWCAGWLIAAHRTLTMEMIPWGIYGTPIAVFLATLLGGRFKFWAMFGVTVSISFSMMIALAFTWLNLYSVGGMGYLPRWQVDDATLDIQMRIDEKSSERTALQAAGGSYASNNLELARELTLVKGKGWKAPSGSSSMADTVEYTYEPTFGAAKEQWRRNLGRASSILAAPIRMHRANLNAIKDPVALNPVETARENFPSIIGIAMGAFGILAAFHGLALAFLAGLRHSRRLHWRRITRSGLNAD